MKNLIYVYNDQHPSLSGFSYSLISQQQFLKRLSDNNINITSQTLRNWEQHNLLTPQSRSGQLEKRGLRVAYSEFSLAEAFAVYNLTNAKLTFETIGKEVLFPKYSLLHVEMARRAFCESRYIIPNFPKPPEGTYIIRYHNPSQEELFKTLPPFSFIFENGQWQVTMPQVMSSNELAEYLFFQGLYGAWFFAMKKGCELFFGDKKDKLILHQ